MAKLWCPHGCGHTIDADRPRSHLEMQEHMKTHGDRRSNERRQGVGSVPGFLNRRRGPRRDSDIQKDVDKGYQQHIDEMRRKRG